MRTRFLVNSLLSAVETVGALTVTTAVDRHLAELSRHRQYLAARSEHDESIPSVRATRVFAYLVRTRWPHRFTVRPATHFGRVLQSVTFVARRLPVCSEKKTEFVDVVRPICVNYANYRPSSACLPPVLELLPVAKTLSSPSVSGGVLLKLSPIGDSLREPRPTSVSSSVLIGSVGLLGTYLWRNPSSDLFNSLKMLSSSNCVSGSRE